MCHKKANAMQYGRFMFIEKIKVHKKEEDYCRTSKVLKQKVSNENQSLTVLKLVYPPFDYEIVL